MSILGGLFTQTALSDFRHPTAWLLDAIGGKKTTSGQTVNASSALTLPTYWAAIRNISEDVSKVPLRLMRESGRSREPARDTALYEVLHDAPNPEMTSMGFRETMMHWALGEGTAFAEVVRDGPDVSELWPIHPSRVRMERDSAGGIVWKVRSNWLDDAGRRQDGDIDIPDEDMFILHGLGNDGIRGYSVVRVMAESIGLSLGLQTYAGNFFAGTGGVNALLKAPVKLNPEAIDQVRKGWVERHSGPEAGRKPAILEPGWDYVMIGVNPEEAQAIESRRFQVDDLARALRMPLSKLGAGSPAAGEREAIDYVVDTLMPWFVRWEQEIRRKLIRPGDRATLYANHVVQGLMRGDHASRSQFYNSMYHVSALSPNDIRSLEDMNPIEGGDTYFAPMNMIPLEAASDFAKAQIAKSAAAPQTTQRNPTDRGGGAENEPKEMALSEVRAIAMGFFAPICQRLAVKEAKALDAAAAKKGGSAFSAWVGPFYASMESEARDMLSEPIAAYSRLCRVQCEPDLGQWFLSARRMAEDAYASGKVESRVAVLGTDVGPEMAAWIVEGK